MSAEAAGVEEDHQAPHRDLDRGRETALYQSLFVITSEYDSLRNTASPRKAGKLLKTRAHTNGSVQVRGRF